MKACEFLQEGVVIDNKHGVGSVPKNQDVDYFGIRVNMKPSVFLKLALPLKETKSSLSMLINHVSLGGAIGAPFLNISLPQEWLEHNFDQPATVTGHEGRHRMLAIEGVFGDQPVETHLFFPGLRKRHLTDQIIDELNRQLVNENQTQLVSGPLFAQVS